MPMARMELIKVPVILLLFFGAKRIPELARSFGVGAKELKKAASEDDEKRAKEPRKVEARERGDNTKQASQADARLGEHNIGAEKDSKA